MSERLYLIQDTRSFFGDSVVWWAHDSKGYTGRFEKAGRYSEAEALRICDNRSTDRAIPLDVAERAVSQTILDGDLCREMSIAGIGRVTDAQAKMLRMLAKRSRSIPESLSLTLYALKDRGLIESDGASPPICAITTAGRFAIAGRR